MAPPRPLYDCHTHVGIDTGFYFRGWWPYGATVQDLLGHMGSNGIERAVCFPFVLASAFDPEAFAREGRVRLQPGRVPYDRENLLLLQECERLDPDRRLSVFAMFDPARRVEEQVAALERISGRIAGLKAQTTVLQSPILTLVDGGRGLLEFAERQDLPVLLHTSINPQDQWAQASDCLQVARAFPKVRFCLAHSLRFDAESLQGAAETPNVWVDCSAHLVHARLARENHPAVAPPGRRVEADFADPPLVLRKIHALLGGRYVWGSDNPFMSWCDDTIGAVYSYREEAEVLHALPAEVKEDMASTATRAWLGKE